MVNVDYLIRIGPDEERFQDLHVAGEDDEIDLCSGCEKVQYALLILSPMFASNREVVVGDGVHLSNRLKVLVIADNADNIHGHFTALPTPE